MLIENLASVPLYHFLFFKYQLGLRFSWGEADSLSLLLFLLAILRYFP